MKTTTIVLLSALLAVVVIELSRSKQDFTTVPALCCDYNK